MILDTLNRAANALNQFAAERLPANRLTGQDALFLHLDQPHAGTHGTMIYIYDQSTVPGNRLNFQDILRHVEQRLGTSPLFRNKVERVAGGLGYPYWVEDSNFDIDFHVRHFALPKPCDWRQFCILASRIHARQLDLNRPLWEMYVIEGLDNVAGLPKGSFAILTKLHHAAVDGTALAELTWALHDTVEAKSRSVPVSSETKQVPHYHPDASLQQTLMRIATDNLLSLSQLVAPVARVTPKLGVLAAQAIRERLSPSSTRVKVPRTRFNGPIDAKRVFETVEVDLAEIKLIRAAVPGATVNDAVLSIVGGALRRYLTAKDELPKSTLMAAAPVNTRQDASERQTSGNSISVLTLPLGTQIADPLQRLAFVVNATTQTKEVSKAVGARELTDISKHTPPATLAFVGRLVTTMAGSSVLFNFIVSNVPGPPAPLYMMGAKLVYWSGVMPISDGMGLFFAVSSYCGKLFISPTSSPVMVPDPEFLAACLRESLAETLQAAQAHLAKAVKPAEARAPAPAPKVASPKRRAAVSRKKVR